MYNDINIGKFVPKGKIIRDSIHGDIFIPEKFLEIIDTPEFQRLRRIKQLSVANDVFPSAEHTRFSHSLGTFYVMGLMINHFEKTFQQNEISIEEKDKEIALLAALLHDIGHGPFSHAFENIHPEKAKNISHVEWTTKIITDKESAIRKAIEKNFGTETPQKTADLINKQRKAKTEENYELKNLDLFSILSSLISSQLDADRLDYLLRDSIHTGVTFGKIDISRIISSLQITVYDNKYFVCIPEKFLQDIEAYLLARYQMQKVVYYHDFKIQMEQLIKLIFNKAYNLFQTNSLEFCPSAINKLFSASDLSVKDYVRLDDSTFNFAFQEWALSSDLILVGLCKSFINREKWDKVNALDNSDPILTRFKQDICALFNHYEYHVKNLINEYFWIESRTDFSAYKVKKENIWILKSNGLVVDICQLSKIIKGSEDEQIIWQDDRKVIFINYNILRKLPIDNIDDLVKDLKALIANYDIRKTIEIEKKYHFEDKSIFEKVIGYLEEQTAFKVEKEKEKEQIDIYFDTDDFILKKYNSTLRIRQKDNKYELTIKRPVISQTESDDQNARFEFQKQIQGNRLDNERDFIFEHLDFLDKYITFESSLVIRNLRTPIKLTNKNIMFEMVFDQVIYKNSNGKQIEDFQIEIELKSDYSHRVNLKILTDDIERSVTGLTSSKTSKYLRGLLLLNQD